MSRSHHTTNRRWGSQTHGASDLKKDAAEQRRKEDRQIWDLARVGADFDAVPMIPDRKRADPWDHS